jgi:amino acid transporter
MALIIIWFAFAICSAVVAGSKNRSAIGWLLLGVIFGIFALIIVACMPSLRGKDDHHAGAINMTGRPDFRESTEGKIRRYVAVLVLILLGIYAYTHTKHQQPASQSVAKPENLTVIQQNP